MSVFFSTFNQTAFLFSFIVIGYVLAKIRFLPENTALVLSKLENAVFIPALVLGTFQENLTVERISSSWGFVLMSALMMAVIIPLAVLLSKMMVKDDYTRRIYTYGLIFSNFTFMGNAVVNALFPEIFLEYLIFTLPLWAIIYLWAVPNLLIVDPERKQTFRERAKSFLNPMFLAMLIGIILGLTEFPLPQWVRSVLAVSGNCMSPIAMLLTGATVSAINIRRTFTDVKLYVLSLIRLIGLPFLLIGVSLFVPFEKTVFLCALCFLSMPLGLNTVVIPSAYGKDTSAAAGMAVISHLLSCITIPLIFLLI